MPCTFEPYSKAHEFKFNQFFKPVENTMIDMRPLQSKCNRPLQMTFEDHLKALVFFHLEEHHSAQHLLQVLEQDDFARQEIAPEKGIKKSSFSEATNERGLEQFMHVFQKIQEQSRNILPDCCPELGQLVGIDGSLIDATLCISLKLLMGIKIEWIIIFPTSFSFQKADFLKTHVSSRGIYQ